MSKRKLADLANPDGNLDQEAAAIAELRTRIGKLCDTWESERPKNPDITRPMIIYALVEVIARVTYNAGHSIEPAVDALQASYRMLERMDVTKPPLM